MSKTVNNLASAGCGCNTPQTVQPDKLAVVPAGSAIVQTPCADSCLPPSSASASPIQGEQGASNCQNYASPCVSANFQVVATDKTGTLTATCASTWAMPGLRLFFPGLGYLEVLGASGDVVTYKNLTIEAGTEVIAGICFHVDAPGVQIVTDPGGGSTPDGGTASSTLDQIWGMEGNVPKHILPVDGMGIVACGGKWQRRQQGLMYYPVARKLAWSPVGPGNKSLTYSLADKPATFNCALGLHAVFSVWIFVAGNPVTSILQAYAYINNVKVAQVNDESASNGASNSNQVIVDVGKGASTTELKINTDSGNGSGNGGGSGTLGATFYLEGYFN